jgi:serine/threonine-protein kinase RsbW
MTDFVLRTTASPASLDEVHELFARLWADAPEVPRADRTAFESAVAELAANIANTRREATTWRCSSCSEHPRTGSRLSWRTRGHPRRAESWRSTATVWSSPGALTDELVYERDGGVNRWFLLRRRKG